MPLYMSATMPPIMIAWNATACRALGLRMMYCQFRTKMQANYLAMLTSRLSPI